MTELDKDRISQLEAQVARLRVALHVQWEYNHAEHCGHDHSTEDHECYWPLPEMLE